MKYFYQVLITVMLSVMSQLCAAQSGSGSAELTQTISSFDNLIASFIKEKHKDFDYFAITKKTELNNLLILLAKFAVDPEEFGELIDSEINQPLLTKRVFRIIEECVVLAFADRFQMTKELYDNYHKDKNKIFVSKYEKCIKSLSNEEFEEINNEAIKTASACLYNLIAKKEVITSKTDINEHLSNIRAKL